MHEQLNEETVKHMHLAELIQEEMSERQWTMTDLIMNMGPHWTEEDWGITQLSWELFFAVRHTNVILGDHMAEQLSSAFDVSKKLFISFHESWRKSELERVNKQ